MVQACSHDADGNIFTIDRVLNRLAVAPGRETLDASYEFASEEDFAQHNPEPGK
jgi:hypothetical protein